MSPVEGHVRRPRAQSVRLKSIVLAATLATFVVSGLPPAPAQAAPCDPPVVNPIVCENSKPGNPPSEWDIGGPGDTNIEGFTTDVSVDQGQTVIFKIRTDATDYRLDIYRMGYYGGMGARRVATVQPSAPLPQSQPACFTTSVGLVDCGNWAGSASWAVPADATSGIYFAKLTREDGTAGRNLIVFVVRDDDGGSDVLFQTSDTTWQAYNRWGGKSLYWGQVGGRAYKVSYNRPFTHPSGGAKHWVFSAEYPMVRWLEANGYDVSYSTGVDSARRGAEILEHMVFMSVGHDEYWSGEQRSNVEAARNAGVHLAFFSGNEVFWKTRWEPSIDTSTAPYRTLVTYKETHEDKKIDPNPAWTGTWRDPRFSPPADGGRPENALTGTIFTVNAPRSDSITVPAEYGKLRLWRNTSVASLPAGGTATFPAGTLGTEWDEDLDNGFRPPGLVRLSSTTVSVPKHLKDWGSNYAPGIATHSLTLYRHASGALVFGSGTIQWSWGLDGNHDGGPATTPDVRMQQATVNLLADMGTQPGSLQSGLVAASPSTDAVAPVSTITSPAAGVTVQSGDSFTIMGTAADSGGGVPAGVEVSTDGGATWHPASGRGSWTYTWIPQAPGATTILSRAVDDSGNLETPSAGRAVTVAPKPCPCSIWDEQAPVVAATSETQAIEVGVKFRPLVDGFISGVRFYKGVGNTGTHIGNLWTRGGMLLSRTTFTNESASGWQEASFQTPVPVTAGTTYVASYHSSVGHTALDRWYFATSGVQSWPLEALMDFVDGGNGVLRYSPDSVFPNKRSSRSANYWVDVVFETTAADTQPPSVSARSPAAGATGVAPTTNVTARFNESVQPASITFELRDPSGSPVPAIVTYDDPSRTASLNPNADLEPTTTYVASVAATDLSGNAMTSPDVWSFTTSEPSPPSSCPCTIWSDATTPTTDSVSETRAVEVGVKFRTSVDGFVTGVRFYKGPTNTGTHIGNLWNGSGALLARATFTNESASGWQQVTFASPVAVAAGTTYIVSYHAPVGGYALDQGYFSTSGVTNGPLEALASGVDGRNGVYAYSQNTVFPSRGSQNANNYWVDVVFVTT